MNSKNIFMCDFSRGGMMTYLALKNNFLLMRQPSAQVRLIWLHSAGFGLRWLGTTVR